MPIQRACGAENQAEDNTSNGPPRVQSNEGNPVVYSATQGMRQLPGTFCMDLNAQEGQKMNFTPQLSEVRAIAAEKKYDVVPISCEICALMPGRLQSAA